MKTRAPLQIALCLLVFVLVGGPAVGQSCQTFQGIDHCAVGAASLSLSAEGLVVQTAGGTGADGVRSTFDPTTLWHADVTFPEGEVEHTTLSSISGGESTSRLTFEPEGEAHRVRATFTGSSATPTYSVLVYDGGVLQAAAGGLYGGEGEPNGLRSGPTKIVIKIGDVVIWDSNRRRRNRFSIAPPGGCNWGVSYDQAVTVQMPDGSMVQGDEVVFSEDVQGPGHYPYLGFEAIETTTSVSQFIITAELAQEGE